MLDFFKNLFNLKCFATYKEYDSLQEAAQNSIFANYQEYGAAIIYNPAILSFEEIMEKSAQLKKDQEECENLMRIP